MPSLDPTLQAQMSAFSAFLVKHPRLEEMDQDLMRRISGRRRYTLLAIFGAAGVGKSTVMHRVAEKLRAEELDPSVVPVVVIRAKPEDVGASARLDYYRQILKQLQGHVAVRDRVKNLPLFTNPERKSRDPAEWLEMRDAVQYALALLRVQVVFVDEAQHLMYVDTPHKPTAQLDWLKTFTEEVPCCAATPQRMKMAYTASSGEHVEIVSLLVPLSLKRKLIGVRPESLIVATCASREHAKETCCCFRTYCSSSWKRCW